MGSLLVFSFTVLILNAQCTPLHADVLKPNYICIKNIFIIYIYNKGLRPYYIIIFWGVLPPWWLNNQT